MFQKSCIGAIVYQLRIWPHHCLIRNNDCQNYISSESRQQVSIQCQSNHAANIDRNPEKSPSTATFSMSTKMWYDIPHCPPEQMFFSSPSHGLLVLQTGVFSRSMHLDWCFPIAVYGGGHCMPPGGINTYWAQVLRCKCILTDMFVPDGRSGMQRAQKSNPPKAVDNFLPCQSYVERPTKSQFPHCCLGVVGQSRIFKKDNSSSCW